MSFPLADQFSLTLMARNRSAVTIHSYLGILSRMAAFLESRGVAVEAAQERDIEQWLVALKTESNLTNLTIRSYLVACRVFYLWCERQGVVPKSPAKYLKFGAHLPIPRIPDLQTTMDLICAPPSVPVTGHRDRAMAMLILGSGCRIAEVCGMRLQDIDLRSGHFRVLGKGAKERFCFLCGDPLEAMTEYITTYRPQLNPKTDHLWVTQYGSPLKSQDFRRTLETRLAAAGFQKHVYPSGVTRNAITPHKLRHLFASTLRDRGADLLDIRDLLGHATIDSTQIYVRLSRQHLQQAHGLFPKRWTPPPTSPQSEAIGGGAGAQGAATTGLAKHRNPEPIQELPKNTIPFPLRRSA